VITERLRVRQFIRTDQDLNAYLAPLSLQKDECVVFALEEFHSRLAMEMLQTRMRKQGQMFDLSGELVPCMVLFSDGILWANRSVLQALNTRLSEQILQDPIAQIMVMKTFLTEFTNVLAVSEEFERTLERGMAPAPESYLQYVDAVTNYQSLDALKFALKIEDVRRLFDQVPGMNADWCEALVRPAQESLFTRLYRRQLELLLVWMTSPDGYADARADYRRQWGFLETEDLDCADFDTDVFVDSKMKELAERYDGDPENVQEQLQHFDDSLAVAGQIHQGRMNCVLHAIDSMPMERIRMYNLLRLWSTLLQHQDMNRLVKMRFFRNMHRVCQYGAVPPNEVGLQDLLLLLTEKSSGIDR